VLLPWFTGAETAAAESDLVDGVRGIGEVVARLGAIVRFAETDVGGGPMLDLDASAARQGRRRVHITSRDGCGGHR
jgi:hypothetical protein